MSFLDDAMTSIGQGLAQTAVTALSAETGVNVGGTLNVLFGGDQKTGGAILSGLLPTVQGLPAGTPGQSLLEAQVNQQTQDIANLGIQLNGISTALQTITGDIANIQQLLQAINEEELYNQWEGVDNHITLITSDVQAKFKTYGHYTTKYRTTPVREVSGLVDNILNQGAPASAVEAIKDFINGTGQQKGVLQLWSNMVTPLVQQGQIDYRLAVQQYFQYYQKLAYTQLKATNLIMEAYNFNGDKDNSDSAWTDYKAAILSQEVAFITGLVPLVYAGVEGGSLPFFGGRSFTLYDASMQLNPGVQKVAGDVDPGNAFYQPSRIFKDAEQLLANLFVTSPTDRRIVVHMIYANNWGLPNLLGGLDLTLEPSSSTQTISSLRPSILGSPFPFPAHLDDGENLLPDENFIQANGIYLKRYVFTDAGNQGTLTDGQYTLSDLNGHNGLVPIATYITEYGSLPPAPFQQNSVINYILEVNAASPFDFMNFCAYSVPVL